MKSEKKNLYLSIGILSAFAAWTALICLVDVRPIGPNDSIVGLATLNSWFHNLTGVHMMLYVITDWLGLVPVAFGFGFAVLGLAQWICRRNILEVDSDILVLGVFYIFVLAAYLLFEEYVINYRPVLINSYLEASYPSSTTLLVLCVMPTAVMQLSYRLKHIMFRRCAVGLIYAFVTFIVTGRLVSGVHWLSDIIGGILLSVGLVLLYRSACARFIK